MHTLNWHEASPADSLHTLHDGRAGKVVVRLDKAQRELRWVVLIGGVTKNAAMVAALRGSGRPRSGWCEAWGGALLRRDEPRERTPQTRAPRSPGRLPPLGA